MVETASLSNSKTPPSQSIPTPQPQTPIKPKEGPVGNVTIESVSDLPAVPEQKQNDESQPVKFNGNAKYIFILLGIVCFVVIISQAFMIFSKRDSPPTPKTVSQTNIQTKTDASEKYQIDTDADGIPDFIETEIGTSVLVNECKEKTGCGTDLKETENKQTNLLFILDSSGSMAEKVDGIAKMDTAKTALKSYLDKVSDQINLGLMVYGHKGNNSAAGKAISCTGIEILYPISTPDKVTFKARIDSFSPIGWTPIADSLKLAQTAFAGQDSQTNRILLVSDGIETCDGNPAIAAQELKQAGIAVTIDVIGFAVDATAKAQLQQVAQLTGGTYFEASNSEEFIKAFDTISGNINSLFEQGSCLSQNFMVYQNCLADFYMKALSYLNNQIPNTTDPAEAAELNALVSQISAKYSKLSGSSSTDYQQNLNQNSQDYQNQTNPNP